MSDRYLELVAKGTGSSTVLVNGTTDTGYGWLYDGVGLGAPVLTPQFSRSVDSDGVRVVGFQRGVREIQIPLLVQGAGADAATLYADMVSGIDALERLCADVRRGCGTLYYRPSGATQTVTFNVASAIIGGYHDALMETSGVARLTLSLVVDPMGSLPPHEVVDRFAVDSLGTEGLYNRGGSDWTALTGALTNGNVTGGVVDADANLATRNVWEHTGTGNTYGDAHVSLKHVTGVTVTAYTAGVLPKVIDSDDYIECYVDKATDTLRIDKVVGGSRTNLANTAVTALAASTPYWIEGRIENNTIYAAHWTAEPTPIGTSGRTATSYTLSTSEAASFGKDVEGTIAVSWTPIDTEAYLDDFKVLPYTYRSLTLPDVLPLNGAAGGVDRCPADILFTGSGGTAPVALLAGWYPKPATHNLLWNGGAECVGTTSTVAYGWSAAAVTGVIGAATSIQRDTTTTKIRTGSAGFEIVCPATSDTGASFLLYGTDDGYFRKGVTYTAHAYLKALAGTTNVRVKLGINGDIATETASALSTTWTLHTVEWTPAADTAVAYFAVGISAATATTFQMDDVEVFVGTTNPTFVPGAYGPGIIPAAAYDSAAASVSNAGAAWTLASDATYRCGYRVRNATTITAGQGNLEWFLAPHLFAPDAYTCGEVDVAVFGRCEVGASKTSVTAVLSVKPEGGSSFGAVQYSEFGASGKSLKLPSADAFRPYYFGTVTLRVDTEYPARVKLCLAFTDGGGSDVFGLDYLILVPAYGFLSSQTGVDQDSAFPSFVASTSETTKRIRDDLSTLCYQPGSSVSRGSYPDASLCRNKIRLSNGENRMVVWPSDIVIDRTDAASTANALAYSGTVSVLPRTVTPLGGA